MIEVACNGGPAPPEVRLSSAESNSIAPLELRYVEFEEGEIPLELESTLLGAEERGECGDRERMSMGPRLECGCLDKCGVEDV